MTKELLALTEKDLPGCQMWIIGAVRELCFEVEKLREALEFYANKYNYKTMLSAVELDEGDIARAALAERGK